MNEEFPEAGGGTDSASPGSHTGLNDWLIWLQQMMALAAAMAGMASAEGRLAIADAKRLLIALVVLIPFALLTWLGLCIWLAWLVYAWSESVGSALFAFFFIQAAVCWYLRLIIKNSTSSLSMPRTRQHLRELIEDLKSGTSGSGN